MLSTPARTVRADPEQVTVRGGNANAGGFGSRASEGDSPREITDAASLLAPLPGVHVRRLGGDDALSTISIRGSSSSQVAVLLGGVPLTGGADPSLDLASLPLWPGAEMRVYRSFAPATLGQGSLGGTLVLRAPRQVTKPRTEVWSAVGSFGALRLRAGDARPLGEGPDAAFATTALSVNRSDGDFDYVDPIAAAAGEQRIRTRDNAKVAAANGLVQWSSPLRLASGRTGRLTVLTLLQARRQGIPGTTKAPTTTETLTSARALASVELALPVSETGTLLLRTWGRRDHLALRSREDEAALSLSPTRTSDAIAALGGSAGIRILPERRASLDVRADVSGERFAPGKWEGATSPNGATRLSTGLGADLDVRPAERLVLNASGRADVWHDATLGAPTELTTGTSGAEDAARGTGHLGAELDLEQITLATHAGHMARAPGFVERYGNRGVFLGSPGLRPEAATTVDLGLTAEKKGRIASGRIELVGFSTWARDLIVFVPQGAYGRAKATNIGEARILGLEADARATTGPLELRASYTFLDTANASECDTTIPRRAQEPCVAPPLPGRPGHDLVVDLVVRFGLVRVRYGVDVMADLRADLTGSITVPPRALQSVGAKLELPWKSADERVTFAFDVANLTDSRVATYAGVTGPVREPIGDLYEYPLPGRSFLLSARLAR